MLASASNDCGQETEDGKWKLYLDGALLGACKHRYDAGVHILPVDWNLFQSALQHSQDGHNLKALALMASLMADAESDNDRAAIVLGEASCYSQLGNVGKSRERLELAKHYAGPDPALLSQVEMSEASLDAQEEKYDAACEKFAALKSKYHDVLVRPENDDFALELDSRLACALLGANKYDEAISTFKKIFERGELEDKQRAFKFL